MKAGDLVTLSAYGEGLTDLHRYKEHRRKREGKPALIGLVVRAWVVPTDDASYRFCNSENEKTRYYINWMSKESPASRWGNRKYYNPNFAYFFRNDLKLVRSEK
jgi:hypothetical protein